MENNAIYLRGEKIMTTPHALTREQVITEREMTEMAQAFGHDLRWVGFCLKVKAQRQALAAMTAERNAAETERIEWVRRAERAESLVEEIKEVRDEYHQQWMDALESEERGKAQLTASEQELMKVRAEKDEQWVKLCAAERKAVRLRETLEEIIRQCPYGATPAERNIAKLAQRALKGA